MDLHEEAVLKYINANPYYYLNHQMFLPYQDCHGGSMPDMVVYDIRDQCFYVVEVTSASNISVLLERVKYRKERWYESIESIYKGFINNLSITTVLFIRKELHGKAKNFMISNDISDVKIINLEDAHFGWKWDWQNHDDGMQYPLNPLV